MVSKIPRLRDEGLIDRQRNGRPSAMSKEEMDKARQELSDGNTGWNIRQTDNRPHQEKD
jgi:hypothetical protein